MCRASAFAFSAMTLATSSAAQTAASDAKIPDTHAEAESEAILVSRVYNDQPRLTGDLPHHGRRVQ